MEEKDLLIKEYEEVLITYRENITVLAQIIAFLAVANVTVCVFAFEHNNFYIFLPGAILMLIIYRANHRAAEITFPVVIRGLIIEVKLGIRGIMHCTMLKVRNYEKFVQILEENKLYEQVDDDIQNLKNMRLALNNFKNITLKFDLTFAISRSLTYVVISIGVFQFLLFLLSLLTKTELIEWTLPNLNSGDSTAHK